MVRQTINKLSFQTTMNNILIFSSDIYCIPVSRQYFVHRRLPFLTEKSRYHPMIKESPKDGKSCYFTVEVQIARSRMNVHFSEV